VQPCQRPRQHGKACAGNRGSGIGVIAEAHREDVMFERLVGEFGPGAVDVQHDIAVLVGAFGDVGGGQVGDFGERGGHRRTKLADLVVERRQAFLELGNHRHQRGGSGFVLRRLGSADGARGVVALRQRFLLRRLQAAQFGIERQQPCRRRRDPATCKCCVKRRRFGANGFDVVHGGNLCRSRRAESSQGGIVISETYLYDGHCR
jgi:hypothetical protein